MKSILGFVKLYLKLMSKGTLFKFSVFLPTFFVNFLGLIANLVWTGHNGVKTNKQFTHQNHKTGDQVGAEK